MSKLETGTTNEIYNDCKEREVSKLTNKTTFFHGGSILQPLSVVKYIYCFILVPMDRHRIQSHMTRFVVLTSLRFTKSPVPSYISTLLPSKYKLTSVTRNAAVLR